MGKLIRAALVGLFAVAGCGGGGIAIDELDDEFDDAICDQFVRCGAFETASECREYLGAGSILDPDVVAGVDNGTIEYDEDAARDCLDAISGQTCAGFYSDDEAEACDRTFIGTVADGGTCLADEQCVSGECDEPIDCAEACCEGTCGPTVADAEIGQSCADADCVLAAYCDETDVCVERHVAGTPCNETDQCKPGLYCMPGQSMATCEAPPAEGDPCVGGESCPTLGLTCDFETVTCVSVLHEGADCNPENDLCSRLYLYCNGDTSKCTGYPGPGEACIGFRCSPDAYCEIDLDTFEGNCIAKKDDGAQCEGDSECTSDYCDDVAGTCGEPASCIAP